MSTLYFCVRDLDRGTKSIIKNMKTVWRPFNDHFVGFEIEVSNKLLMHAF